MQEKSFYATNKLGLSIQRKSNVRKIVLSEKKTHSQKGSLEGLHVVRRWLIDLPNIPERVPETKIK